MRCGIVGKGTHSVEAGRNHQPTIAHVPTGTVHRLPLEKDYPEKVPAGLSAVLDARPGLVERRVAFDGDGAQSAEALAERSESGDGGVIIRAIAERSSPQRPESGVLGRSRKVVVAEGGHPRNSSGGKMATAITERYSDELLDSAGRPCSHPRRPGVTRPGGASGGSSPLRPIPPIDHSRPLPLQNGPPHRNGLLRYRLSAGRGPVPRRSGTRRTPGRVSKRCP